MRKQHILIKILCVVILIVSPCCVWGESADSISKHINEVVVLAKRTDKTIIPVQSLGEKELQRLSVHSVADALRYFSGVQLKDYGGIGGLKTVNVRSLGTNHTGVFYDGIELGNAQNGVVDLGRFSLDNMEAIQLYNGQKSNIFQTAKDYSSASAVYMQTRTPFFDDKPYNLKLAMKAGSFDTYNPSVLWEQEWNNKVSTQLSAEYMQTSGRYKFRYAKKNGYDTTEVRRNGDVKALRVELGVFGKIEQGSWKSKIYIYNSERGYPGAAVREEPGKFRHQDRQWDTSLFGQTSWRKRFTSHYSLLLNGKLAYDYLHYLSDPRVDVTTMYVNNHYRQTEGYLSAAHLFEIKDWWSVSVSNDILYNYLDADLTNFVYPSRITLLSALATNVQFAKISAQASLLHTYVSDHTEKTGGSAGDKSELTPTIVLSYKPTGNLALRGFYKHIFRMPTFNDLYYTFIGNKALKPEYTTQYDIGFTYSRMWNKGVLQAVEWQTDGYYNRVQDKIVAMPTSNQFRWTMLNFGVCHIWGLDTSLKAHWRIGGVGLTTSLAYTYTKAMDKTDRQSDYYGGQLPYIPWHSGSAVVAAEWKRWTANYSFIYTGERYESSANTIENYSKPWYTSDLSLSYTRPMRHCSLRVTAEVNNIFNQQYEVVQCYPMPGTNFKIKLNIDI